MRIWSILTLFYTTEPVLIIGFSYRIFESNLDDYLDDEMEELKRASEVICKDWERSVSLTATSMVCIRIHPGPCAVHRSRSLRRAIGHTQRSCPDPGRPSSGGLSRLAQSRADETYCTRVLYGRALAVCDDRPACAIGTGVGATIGTGVVQGIARVVVTVRVRTRV